MQRRCSVWNSGVLGCYIENGGYIVGEIYNTTTVTLPWIFRAIGASLGIQCVDFLIFCITSERPRPAAICWP